MSRLMRIIGQNCAQHEVCLGLFADWEKDAGITSGVLPLCLCAALHALALERIKHGLVEGYIRQTQPLMSRYGTRLWAPFNNTNNSFAYG